MLTYLIFIAIGAILGGGAVYFYLLRERKPDAERSVAWKKEGK